MLPIPTSRVFRSRRGALKWSFWVLVATVMAVGFGDAPPKDEKAVASVTGATDTLGMPVDDQNLNALVQAMNAM